MTPWLNGLPWKPYAYNGTGRDVLTGRHLQPCGTEAAYRRHLRRGETPVREHCQACADANLSGVLSRSDGINRSRRSRYRKGRDAGLSAAEASRQRYGEQAA